MHERVRSHPVLSGSTPVHSRRWFALAIGLIDQLGRLWLRSQHKRLSALLATNAPAIQRSTHEQHRKQTLAAGSDEVLLEAARLIGAGTLSISHHRSTPEHQQKASKQPLGPSRRLQPLCSTQWTVPSRRGHSVSNIDSCCAI